MIFYNGNKNKIINQNTKNEIKTIYEIINPS